jgi:hypothetical protein
VQGERGLTSTSSSQRSGLDAFISRQQPAEPGEEKQKPTRRATDAADIARRTSALDAAIFLLDQRQAPWRLAQVFRWEFPAVQLRDTARLSCSYRGHLPAILHACLTPKPWQRNGVRRNAYVSLLRHLLNAPNTELQVPSQSLWLRNGFAANSLVMPLSLLNIMNPDDGIFPNGLFAHTNHEEELPFGSAGRGRGGAAHAQ